MAAKQWKPGKPGRPPTSARPNNDEKQKKIDLSSWNLRISARSSSVVTVNINISSPSAPASAAAASPAEDPTPMDIDAADPGVFKMIILHLTQLRCTGT